MENFKKPRAVFFDWDGTLADTYQFLNEAHSHVRGRFGLAPFAEGEYKNYFGKPRETLYPLIYGQDNFAQAKIWFEEYVVANREQIKPLAGADEMLTMAHDVGYAMGVVSNKKSEYIAAEAQLYGWSDYFLSIVGAGDAAKDKPSTAPLLMALDMAGLSDVAMGELWFVGDTDSDLKCAAAMGCVSVLIANGMDVSALAEEYRPDLVVADCADLQEKLLQCLKK